MPITPFHLGPAVIARFFPVSWVHVLCAAAGLLGGIAWYARRGQVATT